MLRLTLILTLALTACHSPTAPPPDPMAQVHATCTISALNDSTSVGGCLVP